MAYAALVTMAALPILFGSFKSIGVIGGDSVRAAPYHFREGVEV